jgi:hypothetical protein
LLAARSKTRKFVPARQLFRGSLMSSSGAPRPIDKMSFDQIAAFMGSIDGHTAVTYGGALTHRLYEIALYDNHVPEPHREAARKLLESLIDSFV